MIFNLFKRKNNWQHKDSNVRIAAINEELNSNNNEDKTLLLSLLNEDDSELVRRAVLLKFNHFDEYFNASIINNKKALREFATGQVQTILAGSHKIVLSTDQKHAFLTKIKKDQSLDTSLLNHWLEQEVEPSLILSLFNLLVQKKNTAQFLVQVFTKKQSSKVQKQLLSLELTQLNEVGLLIKLSKKAVNDDITGLINDRLARLNEQKEKPKKLLKQKQLVLSKLLALKDQANYGQYLTTKNVLVQEWQHDLSEITCLSEEEQQTLLDKFNNIIRQLTQIFAPKEEAYQQAKIAEQLRHDKKTASDEFNTIITELNQKITTAVFEGENPEVELLNKDEFSNNLSQLNENITASVLNASEQAFFLKKTAQLENRLTKLPEIAQSVSDATYLISKISQLALPQTLADLNEGQQRYSDWLSRWQDVNQKACGSLPQSMNNAHKEITQHWNKGLKPLQQEQKQLFDQTKKKLIDLKRLLASGKYKVCFGLFKGVNQAIILLSTQQQQQLQRDFDNVSKKMAEISDWEHYIATPRKQALLVAINALVTEPLDDPNAQADKVKQYRKNWNLLGHAEEDLDKALNDQFNIACEQAFAPCRLFYAEQEKLREQHLGTRNQILTQAAKLAQTITPTALESSPIDFKALDGKLNKLQQRWQQAGEVDRQQYQSLLKQFKNTLQPVNKAIKYFHDDNATKKQALIDKAEQQLHLDDIYQAIELIKQLQKQWRDIGFAGSQQESKLWQKFRSVNDQVFAKRDQVKSKQQLELAQLAEGFTQALTHIKADIVDENKSSHINGKEQAQALLNQVLANKPVLKSVVSAIETFMKQTETKIDKIKLAEESQCWQSLFSLLEKMAQSALNISAQSIADETAFQQLTSFWQKRLTEQCLITTQVSADMRADKTLELEILAQVESPAELAEQRMTVQVSLMQEQMQSSTPIDLTQSFVDWLRLGKLEKADSALLVRVKKVFIQ